IGLAGGASDGNVRIARSFILREVGCSRFYAGPVSTENPGLAGALLQLPGRVSRVARLLSLDSPAVDFGLAPPELATHPAQACTASDQRGVPRPQDGALDGIARCDAGAHELDHPDAAIHVVTSAADGVDVNPGDGLCDASDVFEGLQCTLRAAVMEANARPGIDAIRFAEGFQSLLLLIRPGAPGTGAADGDLDVTESLLVDASGPDGLPGLHLQQTDAGERLFEFHLAEGERAWLRGLRMSGGSSAPLSGGAVRIAGGRVRMERVEIDDNEAASDGGAISVIDGSGRLELLDSDLHHNRAPGRGAAILVGPGARAEIERSSFWENLDEVGGPTAAIYTDAGSRVHIRRSTLSGNSGGIEASNPDTLSLVHSTVVDNAGFGYWVELSADNNYVDSWGSILAGIGA